MGAARTIPGMWLRRFFYRWMFPAAVVLPLWLLIGWGVFNAGGWAFLWVLFIAIPSVFAGQLVLTLLMRARPSARESGLASWWDVAGFTLWHGLTIAVGFYPQSWFALLLAAAVVVAVGLFWLMLRQLWAEARTATGGIRATTFGEQQGGASSDGPRATSDPGVFIIQEKPATER